MKENRRRLLEIIRERALFMGKIKLTSGKTSNYYIDCRRVTLDPEGAYLVAEILFEKLKNDNIDALGGPTLGSDPICGSFAVISFLNKKPIQTFIVRKEPKKHGTMKLIEGNLKENLKVAIVDDVATTGNSLLRTIDVVKKNKCKVKRVIVIVDREEGAKENLAKNGYTLEPIFTKTDLGI